MTLPMPASSSTFFTKPNGSSGGITITDNAALGPLFAVARRLPNGEYEQVAAKDVPGGDNFSEIVSSLADNTPGFSPADRTNLLAWAQRVGYAEAARTLAPAWNATWVTVMQQLLDQNAAALDQGAPPPQEVTLESLLRFLVAHTPLTVAADGRVVAQPLAVN